MDTPGPFEKRATEAYYYVTPPENEWPEQQKEEWLTAFNYYTADVVSIHEAYPGHYVQFLRLNASTANKVEKIFGSYAFIEGWAHYCEKMMIDAGIRQRRQTSRATRNDKRAAKYRMAQADEAMLRLCRLCVSIKMHTQGHVGRGGDEVFSGELLLRRKTGPRRSDARHLRSRLSELHVRQVADSETARRLQGAGGREFLAPEIPQRTARITACRPIRLLREIMLKDKSEVGRSAAKLSDGRSGVMESRLPRICHSFVLFVPSSNSGNNGCGFVGNSSTSRNFFVIARERTSTSSIFRAA